MISNGCVRICADRSGLLDSRAQSISSYLIHRDYVRFQVINHGANVQGCLLSIWALPGTGWASPLSRSKRTFSVRST
jgi:hypothetical protein